MLEILQNIISILTTDATLNAIVPVANIFTGVVDVVQEDIPSLLTPAINISVSSETTRSVPTYTRDTTIQLDIWSRNNQLEVLTIYERVLHLLEYNSGNQSSAHIFWMKMNGAVDLNESDRRVWHRSCTVVAWSNKP